MSSNFFIVQAESDHHVKDTYNYVTIQTDTKMPARHTDLLHDSYRTNLFEQAVKEAVKSILEEDKDVRMLHLGPGTGIIQDQIPKTCFCFAIPWFMHSKVRHK